MTLGRYRLIGALLVLVACGTTEAANDVAPTSALPVAQAPPVPTAPATTASVPSTTEREPVTPAADGTRWESGFVSADGRTLTLNIMGRPPYREGEPCTTRYAATVIEETATVVRLRITGTSPAADAGDAHPCPLSLALHTLFVELSAPLGDRDVEVLGETRSLPAQESVAQPENTGTLPPPPTYPTPITTPGPPETGAPCPKPPPVFAGCGRDPFRGEPPQGLRSATTSRASG